jgi:hypothetical protein
MSVAERILAGMQKVMVLTEQTDRLAQGMEKLSVKVEGLDRRVVRLETVVEIAEKSAGKRLAPTRDRD